MNVKPSAIPDTGQGVHSGLPVTVQKNCDWKKVALVTVVAAAAIAALGLAIAACVVSGAILGIPATILILGGSASALGLTVLDSHLVRSFFFENPKEQQRENLPNQLGQKNREAKAQVQRLQSNEAELQQLRGKLASHQKELSNLESRAGTQQTKIRDLTNSLHNRSEELQGKEADLEKSRQQLQVSKSYLESHRMHELSLLDKIKELENILEQLEQLQSPSPPPVKPEDKRLDELRKILHEGSGKRWVEQVLCQPCSLFWWTAKAEPDFKHLQNKCIIEYCVGRLAREFEVPLSFEDDSQCIKESITLLFATVYETSKLDSQSLLSKEFEKLLTCLLVGDEKENSSSLQRSRLLQHLDAISRIPEYQDRNRLYQGNARWYEKAQMRNLYPIVHAVHQITDALYTVPLWDLFEEEIGGVMDRSTKALNVEERVQLESLPLSRQLEIELDILKNSSPQDKLPPSIKNLHKVRGQLGIGNFEPSAETNYFSHLFTEKYCNEQGEIFDVEVLRMPTPTRDRNTSEAEIIGSLQLWIDHLKAQNKRHCYFNHQKLEASILDNEPSRAKSLINLGLRNPDTFFPFSLPLDGKLFTQTLKTNTIDLNSEIISTEQYFNFCLDSMMQGKYGFYFPEEQLQAHFREKSRSFDLSHVIATILKETLEDYMTNPEGERLETLSKEQRQTFLLTAYAKMEKHFSLILKASRNSTCRDGIDRAAIIYTLAYLLNLMILGKLDNPVERRKLRIVFHHAAYFVKTQAVIDSRSCLLLETIRFFESWVFNRKLPVRTSAGYQLTNVSTKDVQSRNLDTYATLRTEADLLARLGKHSTNSHHRRVEIPDYLKYLCLDESFAKFEKKSDSISLNGEKFELSHQTKRDIFTMEHWVGEERVVGSNDDEATLDLFGKSISLSQNDSKKASELFDFHNQKVTSDILKKLSNRYQFGKEVESPETAITVRQLHPSTPSDKTTRIHTYKEGDSIFTKVTSKFHLMKSGKEFPMSNSDTGTFIDAILKINHATEGAELSWDFHGEFLFA